MKQIYTMNLTLEIIGSDAEEIENESKLILEESTIVLERESHIAVIECGINKGKEY